MEKCVYDYISFVCCPFYIIDLILNIIPKFKPKYVKIGQTCQMAKTTVIVDVIEANIIM